MKNPRVTVTRHEGALEVRWSSGHSSTLPYLWLRDNCQCEECRVVQTSEKRFMIKDVPVDLAPAEVELDHDRLDLTWPDGHRTSYTGAQIQALQNQDGVDWEPWDANFTPRRCLFDAFLDEDDAAARAIDDFLRDGAMILEQAPAILGSLERLSPRLGPIREVLFARIHDVQVDPGGYNVAHTAIELPPHNDFASYTWPPSVQALHMLINETPGGESVIVDAWDVLSGLRVDYPDYFELLCTVAIPFREFDDDNETYAVAPSVRLDVDGNIAGLRFSNQLMQTIDPDAAHVGRFYRAYHELCRRLTHESAKVRFRLDGGDILIVAAHRVLHGREAFEPTGRRHLQDAYFELDNVRNHLAVLRRRGAGKQ